MNPDGTLADTSQRADWSYQLDSARVANLYKLDFFLRKSGIVWKPELMTEALTAPANLAISDNTLSWDDVKNARGYLILKGDEVIGFSVGNSFSGEGISGDADGYVVKSVSKNGNLSENISNPVTGIKQIVRINSLPEINCTNRVLTFSEPVDYAVYNLNGQIVLKGIGTKERMPDKYSGIFMIKAKNRNGAVSVKKIIL